MTTRSRSRKVSKAWLHDHINDPYVKLAQREGFRARAAYKLQEIDETLHLLKPGQVVVDLGAAPGAWSQYVRRRFAAGKPPGGTVIALDLLPLEPIDGVTVLQGDFREEAVLARLEAAVGGRPVDVVLSDMAPNLSGIPASDAARMADLVELALEFAGSHLVPRGALVAKVFHGSGYSQLVERFKATFRAVRPIKPKASRDRSAETFLVGIGLKARASVSDIRTQTPPEGPGEPKTTGYTAMRQGHDGVLQGLSQLESAPRQPPGPPRAGPASPAATRGGAVKGLEQR